MFGLRRPACFLLVASLFFVMGLNWWWVLEDQQFHTRLVQEPEPPAEGWPQTCFQLAQRTPEPYTPEYFHTGRQVDTDGVKWAGYQHEGNITWEDWQRANSSTRHYLPHYKILNGRLYYRPDEISKMTFRNYIMLDGVLMALGWFDIPDVDFFFDQVDFTNYPGGPIFQNCANNSTGSIHDGFSIPFYTAIVESLGPTQMGVMSNCLDERYPMEGRINKVVWRGSSRPSIGVRNVSQAFPRAIAASTFAKEEDIADIKVTHFFEATAAEECHLWSGTRKDKSCPDPAGPIPMEDFNKHAFVLDIDGRGWSARMVRLMLSNTPILKQKSRYPDYLTHHYIDQDFVEFFDSDVSNIVERTKEVLSKREKSPIEYHQKKVKKMQEFSRTHLTHFGIARAMAYSLTVYGRKITWNLKMESGFVDIVEDIRS